MSIFSYIQEQEGGFKHPIPLEDGWEWNFPTHIRRSFLYKNSQFERNNDNRENRPYKNIIRPILNIHYRTEGFDVKDIEIFVDNPETYYKSFLVKKFHDKWALQHEMDTFIDELVESFVDYGGVLVKNVKGVRPEVVDLRTLAFCDQTDILSGPFAIKHFFSPTQLRGMVDSGWDADKIEFLIIKSEAEKRKTDGQNKKTPGRYIELYEVHNVSTMDWDSTSMDSDPKINVVGFYKDQNEQSFGVTLLEKDEPDIGKFFKFLKRDPIQGRALGFGAIEELFEPQVWTNFAEIHIAGMLQHASKVLYKSNDRKFKGQNLSNRPNGAVLDLTENKDINQLDNQPRNLTAFTNYVQDMHEHAGEMGAASDLFMGQQPTAGTPFKSLETQLVEGKSLHLWRQGRISTFVDQIYRDWIIPQLGKQITQGTKFLSTLKADELLMVAERVSRNEANRKAKKALLDFDKPFMSKDEFNQIRELSMQVQLEKGDKRFIEIIKDELKGEKLDVSTNIAGKQKDLALLTDKIVNLLRQFIATPELRRDPEMIKTLNEALEFSGMSPIKYSPRLAPPQQEQQGGGSTDGLKQVGEANKQTTTA